MSAFPVTRHRLGPRVILNFADFAVKRFNSLPSIVSRHVIELAPHLLRPKCKPPRTPKLQETWGLQTKHALDRRPLWHLPPLTGSDHAIFSSAWSRRLARYELL
ncbi:hypothetical protein MPTK1_1g03690 [Marchantia polymorpha subsp. ruderalis]|uniref:Uncharacterized protein n=2 Tax=Marchantia polymorpha TaxID=3197 RepID=A0AAF6AL67_MARPO|nr:hypothetical protein MARPO_0005s0238 [Marchantia polymorpha]BBM97187.1 hypothetical protein Mp_1g03690 [Marchantia polymorpha subsp. ruderalis]|eukprot:PTQ48619.1 hypothetical protein MARPO_0005s0238 [Marchantia polymorpha]